MDCRGWVDQCQIVMADAHREQAQGVVSHRGFGDQLIADHQDRQGVPLPPSGSTLIRPAQSQNRDQRRCEDHSEWMRKRGTGASNAQKAAASFSACPQLIVASFNPFLPVAYKAILTSIIQIDHPNPWNSHTKGMKDVEDTDQTEERIGAPELTDSNGVGCAMRPRPAKDEEHPDRCQLGLACSLGLNPPVLRG